ncbi:phage tail tube protein [Yanshouia hominis]|nr:phage tail tube protein [Yanshouia hominis]
MCSYHLTDWEADTLGKVEAPFTFTNYEYLDTITEG